MSDACAIIVEPNRSKNQSLVPVSSGEQKCAPNHGWGAGVRSMYLIHYVISGKGTFYCGPNKFTLQKGQIFVIFPGTIVKYQADSREPWHYAWVAFYGDEAKEIFSKTGLGVKSPVLTVQSTAEALEILRDMPRERDADMAKNLKFSARLYEFLSLLLKNEKANEAGEIGYLTSAKRYIKAYYFEDITVEGVAAHIGVSRKYLFAIFKRALGISPKEYIINYRIRRAEDFLKDGSLPIGSIAYSVGYKDPLNFSKIFKQKTGMSPSEYRARIIGSKG